MKLYIVPGACSLAPDIIVHEASLPVQVVKVDRATKQTADGEDYNLINTKGHVPSIRLDDGKVLTEVAVVLQYLADMKPEAGLIPPEGTFERYKAQEWLNFIATEVHKGYAPLFNPAITPEAKEIAFKNLTRRYAWIVQQLGTNPYLAGDRFTLPDAYLFAVTRWSDRLKFDLSPWPAIVAYQARVAARPAVHAALVAEGLAS